MIFCCIEIIFTPELEFKKPIILFFRLCSLYEKDILNIYFSLYIYIYIYLNPPFHIALYQTS